MATELPLGNADRWRIGLASDRSPRSHRNTRSGVAVRRRHENVPAAAVPARQPREALPS